MAAQRIVVTGGAGFIGRSVVRQLAARGDTAVALVRDPTTAVIPVGPGAGPAELVGSDLSDVERLTGQMAGAAGVIHLAGIYRVGIPVSERPAMLDANVGATERVLDAAIAAGVPRIVYVSTVNAFGNTAGKVLDETFHRDPASGFISYYDETKWLAHVAAERRIGDGAPIVIAQPGVVYGPKDHSAVGQQLQAAYDGKAPFIAFGDLGISPVHVDDLAAGLLAAFDRGRLGEAYVVAGPNIRLREAMTLAAQAGGRRPPRLTIPTWILKAGSAIGPNLGALFGLSPNLREIVRASDGVTYWASSAKAARELGYRARDLPSGFADAFAASAG